MTHNATVALGATTPFWSVFTTVNGEVGLGGGGDATPASLAPFGVRPDSSTWSSPHATLPTVQLTGLRQGRSTLALRVGTVTSSVDVEVR